LNVDGTMFLFLGDLDGTAILAHKLNLEALEVRLRARGSFSEGVYHCQPVSALLDNALILIISVLDHQVEQFLRDGVLLVALPVDHGEDDAV